MVSYKCKFNFEGIKSKSKLGEYSPDELSDIKKRALNLHNRLQSASKRFANFDKQKVAEQAKIQALVDNIYQQDMSKLVDLNKEKINSVDQFFATRLGLKTRAAGLLPSNYGVPTAGRLRENVRDMSQLASGIVEDLVKSKTIKSVKRHTDTIDGILKHHGVIDENLLGELRLDSIEIGQIPRLRSIYQVGAKGDAILLSKFEDLTKRLSDIGLSKQEIDTVMQSATKISAEMDEARMVANALGLDIAQETDIGYISRVFTPDVKRFIKKLDQLKDSPLNLRTDRVTNQLSTDVARGRQTFSYVPEDDVIVSYQLGVSVDALQDMVAKGELQRYLNTNVSDELLQNMVDVGSLSKLPMTTTEVYRYIVAKFGEQLPYKGMKDILVTDPKRITEYYVHHLQESVKKSNMAKGIIKDGVENGWVASPKMYANNPEKYSKFIKVDEKTLQRYYPQYNGGAIYMDKSVHQQWTSMLGMAGDPVVMNQLAQQVRYWGSFVNQSLLINPGYVTRQTLSAVQAYTAGGGNVLRMHEGWSDIVKITRNDGGYEILDNTVKKHLNGTLTDRELYRKFIRHYGSDTIPMTAGTRVTADSSLKSFEHANPFNFARGVNYLKHYFVAFGGKDTAELAFDMFKSGQGEIFGKVAMMATFMETSFKWGLVKSIADNSSGAKQVGKYVHPNVPKFDNIEDLFRYVDDYFTNWDDVGDFTRFMNNTFRPFAVFSMWNVPAQIRQAIRRPQEFENYWRIKSFWNQQVTQDDPNLNEGTVPDFIQKNSPVYLWKDKETGDYVTMLPNNWDPRSDAFSYLEEQQKVGAEMAGDWVGSTQRQREQMEERSDMMRYFQDFFNEGAPWMQSLLSLAFGKDIGTGRDIKGDESYRRSTPFGMSPTAEYILSSYPPFEKLIQSNPGGLLGIPEFRDPHTGKVIIPARPGIFGSRRVDFDISKYEHSKRGFIIRALRFMGLNIKLIDIGRNLQYNFSQTRDLYTETRADLGRMHNDIVEDYVKGNDKKFPKDFERRLNHYNDLVLQNAQLHSDAMRLAVMMKRLHIKPTESFEAIEQKLYNNVKLDLTNDQIKAILEEDLHLYLSPEELQDIKEQRNG